jgi:S-adenosylmethionine synthetase, N-terminal domain
MTLPPNMSRRDLFTSESTTEGHPDKMCDQISDSVLDAILAEDSEAHVACEAAVWPNHAVVFGEYISRVAVPFEEIVRQGLGREHHGHVARAGRRVEGAPSPRAARRTDRDRLPAALPRRHGRDDSARGPRDCGPSHRSGLQEYPVGHACAHAPRYLRARADPVLTAVADSV